MIAFKCNGITAEVYWADSIPSKASPKGWIADVALFGAHISGVALDEGSAQSLAVVLARHLCDIKDVMQPACLDRPEWVKMD